MTPSTILWVYIALLVAGGLIGFLKARSKASVFSSIGFAIPLALCAAGVIKVPWIADILLGILIVVFAMRFAKTKKLMPAGMLAVVSFLVLVAHLLVK